MRIGIFGGTFNPPHEGHKKLALEFMSKLSLDLMMIIPTYLPPHKEAEKLASGQDRMNMCRICFEKLSPKIAISDIELERQGKSYTVDTLTQIKSKHPKSELFFLMGSDMLLTFDQWKSPDEILNLATVCAAPRDEKGANELKLYVERHYPQRKNRFIILDFLPVEVSSTQIRNEFVHGLQIDKEVESYIVERGLYC